MVTITNYFPRIDKDNKPFIALELSGEVEIIQSASSGKFYETAKRCSIPSSFTEKTAKMLLGKQIFGRIERVQSEAYEYTIKEIGEVISLAHTYVYVPDEKQSNVSPKLALGVSVVA